MTADSTPPIAPRVSIGLAVFNGAEFLEQSVSSILAQTYTDFELIISDNASTDETPDIVKRFAEHDARIRYHRNPANIGGANNENQTFRMSRGEYFRWAAHDDICAPELLAACVEALESQPDVVLCHTEIIEIDADGHEIGRVCRAEGSASSPAARLAQLSRRQHGCEATYGLIRASALRETPLQLNYTDSDRVLLCELALKGRFHQLPTPLFYKRHHRGNQYRDVRGRMAWFQPELAHTGRPTFPHCRQFVGYLGAIRRSRLSPLQRVACYSWICGPWLARYGHRMAGDLVFAVSMLLHPRARRRTFYANEDSWA